MTYPENICRTKLKCLTLFFLSLLSFTSVAQKQNIENYQLNDSIVGELEFDYKIKSRDTIFDGEYKFISTKENGREDFRFLSIKYLGNFKDDLKDGEWIFSRKKMNTSEAFTVDNYTVNYLTSGTEDQIKAEFEKGLANGKWTYLKQDFVNSKPKDTLFKATINLKDALMNGKVDAKADKISLNGNFNDKGHLHGEWEIIHQVGEERLKEIKVFNDGVFKRNYFLIDDKEIDIEYTGFDTSVDDDEDNWIEINIDENYFDIFELTNIGVSDDISFVNTSEISKILIKGNQFIQNTILNFGYYKKMNIWKSVRGNEVINFGKFKVRKFEYTKDEKKQISKSQDYLVLIKESLKDFEENSKVTLGKPAYEGLNKIERVFKEYEKNLDALELIVETINNKAFEYVVREDLFPNFAPNISFPNQMSYSFQDEDIAYEHNFPSTLRPKEYNIEKSVQLLKEIADDISKLNDELENVINRMEKEESLAEDEERLVQLKNEIIKKFDKSNDVSDFNQFHEDLGGQIIKFVEDRFNDYGRLQVDEKKEEIDYYLDCFEDISKLWNRLDEFKDEIDRIDEEYTRTVFNPFMMTDISERVKERVYDAFEEVVLPHVMSNLKKQTDCGNIQEKTKNLDIIYKRMIDIRKEDTKEEEKDLRREKNIDKILSILKIELN
ncbi:MAG: hypothetical protein LAT51_00860 [Flavobacteriaceae bacterium]|nr:hypothetical protein [Flavobacteriaceae bacterium]